MAAKKKPRNTGMKLYEQDDELVSAIIAAGMGFGIRVNQSEAVRVALRAVNPKKIPKNMFLEVKSIIARRSEEHP